MQDHVSSVSGTVVAPIAPIQSNSAVKVAVIVSLLHFLCLWWKICCFLIYYGSWLIQSCSQKTLSSLCNATNTLPCWNLWNACYSAWMKSTGQLSLAHRNSCCNDAFRLMKCSKAGKCSHSCLTFLYRWDPCCQLRRPKLHQSASRSLAEMLLECLRNSFLEAHLLFLRQRNWNLSMSEYTVVLELVHSFLASLLRLCCSNFWKASTPRQDSLFTRFKYKLSWRVNATAKLSHYMFRARYDLNLTPSDVQSADVGWWETENCDEMKRVMRILLTVPTTEMPIIHARKSCWYTKLKRHTEVEIEDFPFVSAIPQAKILEVSPILDIDRSWNLDWLG